MVNMTDFHNKVQAPNPTRAILDRQKELMAKYEGIEEKNGLLETHDVPVDIDSYKGQARLKNFAWRVTEELTEALEPLYGDKDVTPDTDEYTHMMEEFIDAVHFMAELAILSGLDMKENDMFSFKACMDLANNTDFRANSAQDLVVETMGIIMNLGLAMNCLKNKPWKQTHVTTDVIKYRYYVLSAARSLTILLGKFFRLVEDDLVNCYLNKADVNKFRQESGY